jgi:class 3 adenylate cyclase
MAARAGEGSPYAHGISVGIDSGPMICGSIGSRVASRLDYTVLGDVVNNAARLQATAKKGQILINAALRRRLEGGFECEVVPGQTAQVYDVRRRISESPPISSAETVLMDDESRLDESHERSSTGGDLATPLPA